MSQVVEQNVALPFGRLNASVVAFGNIASVHGSLSAALIAETEERAGEREKERQA